MMSRSRTQVAIIGAGPSGLLLGALLLCKSQKFHFDQNLFINSWEPLKIELRFKHSTPTTAPAKSIGISSG